MTPLTLEQLLRVLESHYQQRSTHLRDQHVDPTAFEEFCLRTANFIRVQARNRGMEPRVVPRLAFRAGFDVGLRVGAGDRMTDAAAGAALEALRDGRTEDAQAILEALVGRWETPTPPSGA